MVIPDLSKYRKAVVAIIGAAAILVAHFVPDYTFVLQVVIAVATALGVYEVPNAE